MNAAACWPTRSRVSQDAWIAACSMAATAASSSSTAGAEMAIRPVWRDGAFQPRKMMNLSSSFDHRIVDGWEAAEFVQRLRALLECPTLLFVDQQ